VNLIRAGAADAFNIVLALVGGILPAMRMIAIAESFGMSVYFGTAGESGVGTAATAHVASTVRHLPYASDCWYASKLPDDIVVVPVPIEPGFTHVPGGPGLGVELDEDKLQKYLIG
jgi:muconate cycloisomerase